MRLMPRTIGMRLAWAYALAVGATVLIYAALFYGFTRSALLEALDRRLQDDLERTEHEFEVAADGSLSWREVEGPFHAHEHGSAAWAEVRASDSSQTLRWPEEGPGPGTVQRTRRMSYPLAGSTYELRVGRSREPLDMELASLRHLLLLCLLPVVLLSGLLGRWLARRSLEPVGAMTRQARRIGAEALSERLPVANPDDELGQLATVFNEAFARIEGSFVQLRRFTSDAAHEIRTPLAALRAVGEVGLAKDGDQAREREVIGSMLEETERLARLVEQLLQLSHGDAQKAMASAESVELGSLVRKVMDQLAVLAAEREQRLVLDIEESLVIQGEPATLRSALINIVDNAIRHGPEGSPIDVRVSRRDGRAVVAVSDAGPGIPESQRERVFERFYRADAARTGHGTGLGLSIARQAARRHGGNVELDCPAGGGTTFRLVLPVD